jgi:hypothetical protein
MQESHTRAATSATFDDRSVIAHAGLVPLLRLADNAGLTDLATQRITIPGPAGANPSAKLRSIIAGMAAGADSINDLDVLRNAATSRLFQGVRAPSTLGTFLRGFHIGHLTALDALSAQVLIHLTRSTGRLLPGVAQDAYWTSTPKSPRSTDGRKSTRNTATPTSGATTSSPPPCPPRPRPR